MIWLLLSITCSSAIFVVFKFFDRFGIDNLQAIVVNYFVAFIVGYLSDGFSVHLNSLSQKPWLFSIVILGFLFITLFQLIALVSQKFGVASVSVAVKMSLIIPVIFSVWRYGDDLGFLKITGIITALIAVYLGTRKKRVELNLNHLGLLPFVLFLGSGFLDAFLKYNQNELVQPEEQAYFTSMFFAMAAISGCVFVTIRSFQKKIQFKAKNILGGIFLGIPNYGSIYFLLKALNQKNWEGSVIFPINNVGIVALSVVAAKLIFNEKISTANKTGIILALLSILLISYSNFN